jgi:arginase family enzyme
MDLNFRPLVLDFDGSVGALDGEVRLKLPTWQESVRFGCRLGVLRKLAQGLQDVLANPHGTVFLGSGDFHHLSLALLAGLRSSVPIDVVVFDNHPDNMRYPFGVHCGSWVSRAAGLPGVRHVQVLGITSPDVELRNAWQNRLRLLYARRVSYRCIGVDTAWARRVGLGDGVLSFDTAASMLDRLYCERRRSTAPVYLSIDKDVLAREVAQTNWDQGCLTEDDLAVAMRALRGPLIGSDITGDVSRYRYASPLKRFLSALDDQPVIEATQLAEWQRAHSALNRRLLGRINAMS